MSLTAMSVHGVVSVELDEPSELTPAGYAPFFCRTLSIRQANGSEIKLALFGASLVSLRLAQLEELGELPEDFEAAASEASDHDEEERERIGREINSFELEGI